MKDRRAVVVIVLALALGWWLGSSPASPVNPHPVPDRPVLSALARITRTAARLGLWFALAGEPAPEPDPAGNRQGIVHARLVDAEGHPVIDHREGW